MMANSEAYPKKVIGPLGKPIGLADLPRANLKRWLMGHKAEVIAAVRGGLLTHEEAFKRYNLTHEEFSAWQKAVDRSGSLGLRARRFQSYGPLAPSREL